ncbi:hypothetical protein M0766_29985 (plasmid) [Pseudomonas putida]|uniref:Putative plasmid transfer protein TraA n=2 Tax=Pseudomonas TaxID=286 RepID=Q1XGM9_PSEPU|nr:putative plasmid transfer protein TraB [Pseudomonas sp. MC1]UPU95719.1 hypothetical protein M0766_29985 [Pseudomonas putida]BAE92147.1 putative plasmid transfer protein TraA [Pseudomonas putida]
MAKTLPIRLNDDQEARLEQAAALAGYKHLSTYVRDRALSNEKSGGRQTDLDSWADQQRMLGLLENVSQAQAENRTLLTIAVYLLRQGLQQGKVNELRAELSHLADADQLINTLLPELVSDIERLSGEDNA